MAPLSYWSALEKGLLNPYFSFISAFQLFLPSVDGSEGFIRNLGIFLCVSLVLLENPTVYNS